MEIVEERRVVNGSAKNGNLIGNGSSRKRGSATITGRILGREDEEEEGGERDGQLVKRSRN